jgi:hypothetical protein
LKKSGLMWATESIAMLRTMRVGSVHLTRRDIQRYAVMLSNLTEMVDGVDSSSAVMPTDAELS